MRILLAAGLLCLLSACATGITVRRLPPETPAADTAAAIKRYEVAARQAAQMASPAADHVSGTAEEPPLTPAEAPSLYTYDPLERLNRFTYRFNARFDEHIFLPVANGYRRMPGPIRQGIHNFFDNLREVSSTANYIMQLRLGGGARSLGRFIINSTLGIGGLLDVARQFRLSPQQTGFGATLSTWGVPPGPYLVVPLLGPSTLRDGAGLLGDYGITYGVNVANLYRGTKTWALGTVSAIDQRANIDFRYYGSGSPFEYETIRFLYVHRDLIQDEALRKVRRHKLPDTVKPAGK
ncbi:MAG TPA: VacJ family lipoprotein [Steroidobacteraceae bacterium]|nr:VacJ family lipoprotein [Steroidobacteraceae bacterium]